MRVYIRIIKGLVQKIQICKSYMPGYSDEPIGDCDQYRVSGGYKFGIFLDVFGSSGGFNFHFFALFHVEK